MFFISGYITSTKLRHSYYDLLKSEGYNVKAAHPLMVKSIAYAKVKTDKVDARILADLLRTDIIPECYIPDEKIRDPRDLVRRRHYFVNTRTMFKNNIHAELSSLSTGPWTVPRMILAAPSLTRSSTDSAICYQYSISRLHRAFSLDLAATDPS
jgi:transposase